MVEAEITTAKGMVYLLASALTGFMGALEVVNVVISTISAVLFLAIGVYTLLEKVNQRKLFKKKNDAPEKF